MTIRYVGPGGSDGASGLTWALRKLTLNGVEDTPVVAGDTIYVGPGTYREQLTIDVNGSSGNIITYIGDETGAYTDGVGGEVRITGSNDDKTLTRAYGITMSGKPYRTFRGFRIDMTTNTSFAASGGCNGLVVEDSRIICGMTHAQYPTNRIVAYTSAAGGEVFTFRRCFFSGRGDDNDSVFISGGTHDLSGSVFENCIFWSMSGSLRIESTYNITINNCSFIQDRGGGYLPLIECTGLLAGVREVYLYNSLFFAGIIKSNAASTLIEDYGYYVPRTTDAESRVNVTKGANSITRNAILEPRLLLDGFYFPNNIFDYSYLSPIKNYGCGQSPPSTDFYGIARPTTDSKKTRGAIQYAAIEREATTVPSGENESIKLPDAAAYQIFVPITGKSMRFDVQVHRESNYAGTLPQMIIKQPGQSDRTTTDVGASGQFNSLSDVFTPASMPPYVVIEIRSNNTATSGNYATYFGGFSVR